MNTFTLANIKFLQDFIGEIIRDLEHIKEKGVESEGSFRINCIDLDEEYTKGQKIEDSLKFKSLFHDLKKITGPTLYWFEIKSNTNSHVVIDAIKKYSDSKDTIPRPTPALQKPIYINGDSKILYVGKADVFWGRILQHLGFHSHKTDQGLQLSYWAKDLSLELEIYYIEFDENMRNVYSIFEYALAQKLRPLVGKHNR